MEPIISVLPKISEKETKKIKKELEKKEKKEMKKLKKSKVQPNIEEVVSPKNDKPPNLELVEVTPKNVNKPEKPNLEIM